MAKFECSVCGYIFDEQQAGIKFSEITECPICAESKDKFKKIEEEEKEKAEEKKDEDKGYVIEKRQEFWLEEKDKDDKEVDKSNIETYYEGVKPVKSPEQLEREAKEKEEKERPRLDPIEGSGAVQKVIEGGDRSSDGSDSEVVVVDEATSDVDEGGDEKEVKEESDSEDGKSEESKSEEKDTVTEESNSEEKAAKESEAEKEDSMKPVENEEDDFVFEENKIESAEPLETQEIPASVSAMNEGGDFFTGFDNNPNMGDKVRTEEFFFDDEEPVGEAVELEEVAEVTEVVEETAGEKAEEAVEEAAEEKAEEPVEEEKTEETVEEVAEETVEEAVGETAEEVAEEKAEPVEEEKAEEATEEKAEPVEEEKAEETVEETVEEAAEETVEEAVEEVAEDKAEETAEETAEEVAEEISETTTESAEETTEETAEETVGTGFILEKKYSLLADAESKSLHVLSGVGPASNGLEGIILLPAQLDPMPMSREEEISAKAVIGKGTEMPVKLDRPFGNTDLFLWGEYIPGSDNADDLSEASLVLVRGKNSHIPNVSGKEELRKEVAKAKEVTGGTPIGISLVIGRIEQDLAACVYAGVDFVVLNDVSSGMLPYALRRAKNYLNHVNSEIELIVSIKDINDAKELAKLIALGADFILLEREYDEITIGQITQELKEIARNTGHKNVHDLNMLDICTIDSDLAKNTDIAHF